MAQEMASQRTRDMAATGGQEIRRTSTFTPMVDIFEQDETTVFYGLDCPTHLKPSQGKFL